jgi:hypothetical protein
MTTAVQRSGFGWRVEAIHELDEHFLEAVLVVVGVVPDECDHLAVTVGSLPAVAARLVHHSEAIPAVVHVGEAAEQVHVEWTFGLEAVGPTSQLLDVMQATLRAISPGLPNLPAEWTASYATWLLSKIP